MLVMGGGGGSSRVRRECLAGKSSGVQFVGFRVEASMSHWIGFLSGLKKFVYRALGFSYIFLV